MTGGEQEDLEMVADGGSCAFPPCGCGTTARVASARTRGSGQKFNGITDIPAGVAVAAVQDAGDCVVVTFAPDQHRAAFSRRWLAEHPLDGYGDGDGRTEDDKELWRPADLAGRLPAIPWPRYLSEPAAWTRALDAVLRLGFVLLHDVPAEPGMVLEVAASFGYVRETNSAGCSTSGSSRRREIWPSPAARSGRIPTTRTAIRCRPCSCCTACAPR